MGSLDPSLLRKDGPWLGGGRKRKLSKRKKRAMKGKGTKKELCKVENSSLICRAPSLRTGKKSPLLKGPNLEVPSSFVDPVQDRGIKGALFQEDDCQDLGIAGENMDRVGLPGVCETDISETVRSAVAAATAGEH